MDKINKTPVTAKTLQEDQVRQFDALAGREIISRREECVKHFDLGAGKRQAVMFAGPVHYRTEDGALAEIDNTLEAVQENGKRLYCFWFMPIASRR